MLYFFSVRKEFMNKIFNAEKEVDDLNIRPSSLNEYIGQEKLNQRKN